MRAIFLNHVPKRVVRREHIRMHCFIFAKHRCMVLLGAPCQLQFQAPGHHGQLPGPYDGTMVGVRGPLRDLRVSITLSE